MSGMVKTPGPFLPTALPISPLSASKTSAICFLFNPVVSARLVNNCNFVSGFSLLAAAFAIWSIPFNFERQSLESVKRFKHNKWARLKGFAGKLQPGSARNCLKRPTKPKVFRLTRPTGALEAPISDEKRYRRTVVEPRRSDFNCRFFSTDSRDRTCKMSLLNVPFGRLFGVAVLIVTSGCLAPKTVSPETIQSSKVDRRENVMLKSKIGRTPNRAGLDSRAQEIENSLGIR